MSRKPATSRKKVARRSGTGGGVEAARKDFFISYNGADKKWAEWIASTLERHGFSTVFQGWDFGPGTNFVLEMHRALEECERVIAVLSPNYLASVYTQPEWAAGFAVDPKGRKRTLFPVRVLHCEPEGLLRAIVYSDLVGLKRDAAARRLIADANGVARTTTKSRGGRVPFPGDRAGDRLTETSTTMQAAGQLYDILQTTRTTFYAQIRLRNQLVDSARRRLKVKERYQYEPFFRHFFAKLDAEELRLHATMRAYTANVLAEYNARALTIVQEHPDLAIHIPSIPAMRAHLNIWLGKYRGLFADSPWMALVYVGVEEKVPFPKSIDGELRAFLRARASARQKTLAPTLRAPNNPAPVRRSTPEPLRRRSGEDF